jgi:hypothetical protein
MVKLASSINKDLIQSGKAEFRQGDVSQLPRGDKLATRARNKKVIAGLKHLNREIFYY